MLAIIDIPPYVQDLYDSAKKMAREIMEELSSKGENRFIKGNTDLLLQDKPLYLFVNSGFFKFFNDGKLIRLYSDGDVILAEKKSHYSNARLVNEFASDVTVFEKDQFLNLVRESPALFEKWCNFTETEQHLMSLLCSLYVRQEVLPQTKFKNYAPGQKLICQGDSSDEIFFMVDGVAGVSVGDKEVGQVKANEFFGEISFLTGQPRSATVTAVNKCTVQCIDRDDFAKLIQSKPATTEILLKTLAERITQLNQKMGQR